MALYLFVFLANVKPGNRTLATGRLVQAREHVHRRGLTCTIGSQEPENLSSLHGKGYIVNGMEGTKDFYQVFHLNDESGWVLHCHNRWDGLFLDGGRIKDMGKLCQDVLWLSNTLHLSLVKKGYPLTTSHFIQIGCRCHDGDASFFQQPQHFPKFLS